MRLFFALPVDDRLRQQIANICQNIRWPANSMLVAPENYHLTLLFLGKCHPSQQEEYVRKVDHLKLPEVNEPLCFSSIKFFDQGICYLSPTHTPGWLVDLAAMLRQHLVTDDYTFKPHITLARQCLPFDIAPLDEPVVMLNGTHFGLYQSLPFVQGVRYNSLHEWVLPH